MQSSPVIIPLDVPKDKRKKYLHNYELVTHRTGRLMLLAGDQKVEHLNDDFYGESIASDDNNPEHLFRIANKARIGAFATQLGLIARYGMDYPKIPYIVKLNAKTNLVKTMQKDPQSSLWYKVEEIERFQKNSDLHIAGVGYTIYLGSEYESDMLHQAACLTYWAHQYGMLSIIWGYARGRAVKNEKDAHLIAGAAGVAACLGADFVKVNHPHAENSATALKEAVAAAGRTKLICAGGKEENAQTFFQTLHDQLHIANTSGSATGRNIHQRPLDEAIRFTNAIASLTFDAVSVTEAMRIYHE
ncbi:MAG TPA: aldolase [Patescibacteria group bacterium]|nr:aldolase [Patescibacteria group bacterium]